MIDHLWRAFLLLGYSCQGSVIAFVSKFVLPLCVYLRIQFSLTSLDIKVCENQFFSLALPPILAKDVTMCAVPTLHPHKNPECRWRTDVRVLALLVFDALSGSVLT